MRVELPITALVLIGLGCDEAVGPAAVARVDVDSYGTVYVGATLQMSAVVTDAKGTELPGRTVTWHSSNEIALTISPTGLVRGLAEANVVTITATCEGVSGTSTVQSVIDLRGKWTGTANGRFHSITLTANRFCPQSACANAGYGLWYNTMGEVNSYTVGYGERMYGSISFDLWNDSIEWPFRGHYHDGTSMTGTLDGVPVVFTRRS
jgi:hypothetical protein